MQRFSIVKRGEQGLAQKVDEIITNRQAPESMVHWFNNEAMFPQQAPTFWNGGLSESHRVLCRTSCDNCQCFKVLAVGTVRKHMQQHGESDPFSCPCHDGGGSWSPHHGVFMNEIEHWYDGPVVWEWVDCAEGHDVTDSRMHWDVTVCAGDHALRIEIDGDYHFRRTRRSSDDVKDTLVRQKKRKLLRLSCSDNDVWKDVTQMCFQKKRPGVYFSQSYESYVKIWRVPSWESKIIRLE